MAFTPSGVNISFFDQSHCNGSFLEKNNIGYGSNVDLESNFLSFYLSRELQDMEQLDINKILQYPNIDHTWACGTNIRNYKGGTIKGCHNVNATNEETVTCFRLWHY